MSNKVLAVLGVVVAGLMGWLLLVIAMRPATINKSTTNRGSDQNTNAVVTTSAADAALTTSVTVGDANAAVGTSVEVK